LIKRLYLASSVKQLLAPTGAALERLAAGGACVFVSYSPGDTAWHRGPSYGPLTPRVNPDGTVTLYDALARHAGVRRLVTADDPRVACDTLIRDDGALFAVLASHTTEQLTVKPALPRGGELTSLGGEETAEGVELGPFGITVLALTRSAAQAKPRPMQPPAGSPAHPRPPSLIGAGSSYRGIGRKSWPVGRRWLGRLPGPLRHRHLPSPGAAHLRVQLELCHPSRRSDRGRLGQSRPRSFPG
jgi:hypothetical protein